MLPKLSLPGRACVLQEVLCLAQKYHQSCIHLQDQQFVIWLAEFFKVVMDVWESLLESAQAVGFFVFWEVVRRSMQYNQWYS